MSYPQTLVLRHCCNWKIICFRTWNLSDLMTKLVCLAHDSCLVVSSLAAFLLTIDPNLKSVGQHANVPTAMISGSPITTAQLNHQQRTSTKNSVKQEWVSTAAAFSFQKQNETCRQVSSCYSTKKLKQLQQDNSMIQAACNSITMHNYHFSSSSFPTELQTNAFAAGTWQLTDVQLI